MKITGLSAQIKNPNRLNVLVDGSYKFSLDLSQVVDLGIKVGREFTEEELAALREEGEFSKLYSRALEYTFMRPHSSREVKDYLWRKTRSTKYKTRQGEIKDREGVSVQLTERVFERLSEKGYIDDYKFTLWWVGNRNQTKGISQRKLVAELRTKGVQQSIIESAISEVGREDSSELQKIVAKRRHRYDDEQKFMSYLARLGFSYDDIKSALRAEND